MSGARHRRKGDRIDRELVALHRALGVFCERVPLSGAQRYQGNGAGFATLESWLGEFDVLFLRRYRADPLVCIPWPVWVRLLERLRK
jgi:hypothetical protein